MGWLGTKIHVNNGECIPKATITQRRNLPWMNSHIRAKIPKKNNTYRKARTTGRPSLWSNYRSLRNEVVQLLRQSKKHHLQRVSTLGSKHFWKTIKYLRKSSSQVPTLKQGSTEVTSNAEKASLLNDVFSSNFNDTIPPLSEIDCRNFIADSLSPPPDDILCTEQEVFSLLNALDTSKASGPDGISAKMLKGSAPSIACILTEIFNKSIISGDIPQSWKSSSVVPIPKSPNTDNPSNYRPISLLSVVSKVMERLE